jgi:hypothetical protein
MKLTLTPLTSLLLAPVAALHATPQIQRLQITDVVAEGLEHVLDHQAGTIEALDLRDLSIPATTNAVHQGGEAKIIQTQQPPSK